MIQATHLASWRFERTLRSAECTYIFYWRLLFEETFGIAEVLGRGRTIFPGNQTVDKRRFAHTVRRKNMKEAGG